MHRGYIKIWRKAADSEMMRNPRLWTLWTYLLLNANHEAREISIGEDTISVRPGELVTNLSRLSEALDIHRTSLRRLLETLKKAGQVSRQVSRY